MSFDYHKAYQLMYRIRRTEEEIVARYHRDEKMRCPTHLSIGQEASAVGVSMALRRDDHMYTYHRSHAHYLAKGGDLPAMIGELHGKANGCSGGWGGSMHLVDDSVSFTEASTAVGDCVSLAVGSALAFHLERSERVAVVCCGDSTVETGQFWEAANFAALHRLPMMFICENNLYSTATPLHQRQPDTPISQRVGAFMWSKRVEDTDIESVWRAALECREARPGFLEIGTYRYLEHVGPKFDWELGYRTKEEVMEHMAHDPVKAARPMLNGKDASALEESIGAEVLAAFEEAEAAPWPEDIRS